MTRFPFSRFVFTAAAVLATIAAISTPAAPRERSRRLLHLVGNVPRPTPAQVKSQPPLNDLYRRRGYGMGGPIFGGDTATAGACAGLRFAEPDSCGRGYGIYGNGLGSHFGF